MRAGTNVAIARKNFRGRGTGQKKERLRILRKKRVLRVVLFFLFLNLTRSAVPKMGTEQYAKIVVTNAENSGDIGLERTSLLLQHMPEMYIWE